MKSIILKQAVIGAVLAMSSVAASAQTASLSFNYLAQATAATTSLPGDYISNLSSTSAPVAKITLTDLADLNLGDGKTGVRINLDLTNFSQLSSGTGSIYTDTLELNFVGTGPSTGADFITTAGSYRNVSNNYQLTTGADGGIEWSEGGTVGATGKQWTPFQQQINIARPGSTSVANPPATGVFGGTSITFDFLNGQIQTGGPNVGQPFNAFSVADFLNNSVSNQVGLPSAYAWLRVRSRDGGIQSTGKWFDPYLTSATSGGVTTQTLQFLAVAAVPEADTYTMMLAGLGLMGFVARRRNAA